MIKNRLLGPRLGIDMGGTTTSVVVTDEGSQVLSFVKDLTGDHRLAAPTLKRIAELAARALNRLGLAFSDIACAGIGVPGEVDLETRRLRSTPILPTWCDVDVPGLLRECTGIPFSVGNDANAALIAESIFGAARDADPVLLITIGTGVGGAIKADGRLLLGHRGSAGEIGHMAVDFKGLKCWCGGTDCLGLYASTTAILQTYEALRGSPARTITGPLLTSCLLDGDHAACQAMELAAGYLAAGIAQASCVIAPERVILCGGLLQGIGQPLTGAIAHHLSKRFYPTVVSSLEVCQAQLGERCGAVGASLLPLV
jgi:glucokinase